MADANPGRPVWTLRVTAPDGRTARVSTRGQQFTVARAVDFDRELAGVTALEYALGAVGGEIVAGLLDFARRRRLPIDAVEAVLAGELHNALVYLEVVGEEGTPALARLEAKVYVSSPAADAAIRRLWDDALPRLPLLATLRAVVPVDLQLVVM